jgi:uncharacterized NAD-dependent epimerase/dehydratase family protein
MGPRHPEFALSDIEEVIDMTMRPDRRTNPAIRCAGVSLNTGRLDADAADALLAQEGRRLELPVADPMHGGAAFDRRVDSALRLESTEENS